MSSLNYASFSDVLACCRFDEMKAQINATRKNVHLQVAPVVRGYKVSLSWAWLVPFLAPNVPATSSNRMPLSLIDRSEWTTNLPPAVHIPLYI